MSFQSLPRVSGGIPSWSGSNPQMDPATIATTNFAGNQFGVSATGSGFRYVCQRLALLESLLFPNVPNGTNSTMSPFNPALLNGARHSSSSTPSDKDRMLAFSSLVSCITRLEESGGTPSPSLSLLHSRCLKQLASAILQLHFPDLDFPGLKRDGPSSTAPFTSFALLGSIPLSSEEGEGDESAKSSLD